MIESISIKVVGHKDGIYIDPVTCDAAIDIRKATNYDRIDLTGANSVIVYRNQQGDFWISQVGGYTEARGIFCDLYSQTGARWDIS